MLSERLRAGDPRATTQLFKLYNGHVRRVLHSTIGRDTEIDDMVQDVFLGALRSAPKYLGDDSQIKAWLGQIAVFTARGYLRGRKRRSWLLPTDPSKLPPLVSREPSPHAAEMVRRTMEILQQMDPELRVYFARRYLDAMELPEIASSCNCSVSTVKRRLTKARTVFERRAASDLVLQEWLTAS